MMNQIPTRCVVDQLKLQTLDPVKDRTSLRLSLLDMGYTPLPLQGKAPRVLEWSKIEVTPELITSKAWARSTLCTNTGIRCGDVVGIDLDIDDEDLLERFVQTLPHTVPESRNRRIGRAPRELWLYRVQDGGAACPSVPSYALRKDYEPFAKAREDAKARGASMEELTQLRQRYPYETVSIDIIGEGKQFAAFGVHPGTGTAFEWSDPTTGELLDVFPPVKDLCVITNAQIMELVEAFAAFMDAQPDYMVVHRSRTDGKAFEIVPKLELDTQLPTLEHGVMSVRQALELGDLHDRCAACGIKGLEVSIDPHNSLVRVEDHQTIYVTNFPSGEVCTLSADARAELDKQQTERLSALVQDRQDDVKTMSAQELDALPDMSVEESPDENMARALTRYALTGDSVIDMATGAEYKIGTAKNLWRNFSWTEPASGKRRKVVDFMSAYLLSKRVLKVHHAEGHPVKSFPTYINHEGLTVLNTWRAPLHENAAAGDAKPFFDLVASLLPNDFEREEFLRWCACAVQQRGVRRYGVIMVACGISGAGRETLFKTLRAVLGSRNVAAIETSDLIGGVGQGQYNDWLPSKELYTVSEFLDGSQSFAQVRKGVEAVKRYVDPGRVHYRITRKTFANFEAEIYGSLIIATNNMDALKIEDSERRRLAIFKNSVALDAKFARFYNQEWLTDAANIAAVHEALMQVDLTGWSAQIAPETETKAEMRESTKSYVERVVLLLLEELVKAGVTHSTPGKLLSCVETLYEADAVKTSRQAIWGSYWVKEAQHVIRSRLNGERKSIRLKDGKGSRKVHALPGVGETVKTEWASSAQYRAALDAVQRVCNTGEL